MAHNSNKQNNTAPKGKDKPWLDVIAIVISVIAMGVSFIIANKQNNISLFEKRFEVYQSYFSLSLNGESIRSQLKNVDTDDKLTLYIAIIDCLVTDTNAQDLDYLQENVTDSDFQKANLYIISKVNEFCVELDSAKYIFSLSSDEEAQIDAIIAALKTFASSGYSLTTNEIYDLLSTICQIDFLNEMESQLSI